MTPADRKIKELREQIAVLDKRVEQLEDENYELREAWGWWDIRLAISYVFKVPKTPAAVVAALVKREVCTFQQIFDMMYAATNIDARPDIKLLQVHMCKLRSRLRKHGIEVHTMWGTGYAMDKANRHKLLLALEEGMTLYMSLADQSVIAHAKRNDDAVKTVG